MGDNAMRDARDDNESPTSVSAAEFNETRIIVEEYEGVLIKPEFKDEWHRLNRVLRGTEDLHVVPESVWLEYEEAARKVEELRLKIVSAPAPRLTVTY